MGLEWDPRSRNPSTEDQNPSLASKSAGNWKIWMPLRQKGPLLKGFELRGSHSKPWARHAGVYSLLPCHYAATPSTKQRFSHPSLLAHQHKLPPTLSLLVVTSTTLNLTPPKKWQTHSSQVAPRHVSKLVDEHVADRAGPPRRDDFRP